MLKYRILLICVVSTFESFGYRHLALVVSFCLSVRNAVL